MKLDEYGRDLACVDDLSYALHEIREGKRGIAESVARRLQVSALFYGKNYGYDLRQHLGAAVVDSPGDIEAGVEAEALKDERVSEAHAVVTYNDTNESLQVSIRLVAYSVGPFDMTLQVTQLSVELTEVG